MGTAIYQVIFSGKIIEGQSVEQVKKNMAALFKKTPAQVEALFTGNPVTIKKDADKETALKYQAILKKAGAQCQIQSNANSQASTQGAAKSAPAAANAQNPTPVTSGTKSDKKARMLRATRDDVNLSVDDDFSGLSIAEPGAILVEPQKTTEYRIEGIDNLSLSDLNVLLSTPKPITPQIINDFSGFVLESLDDEETEE